MFALPPGALAAILAFHLGLTWSEWIGYYLRGFGRIVAESGVLGLGCALAFIGGSAALARGAGLSAFASWQAVAQLAALLAAVWYAHRTAPWSLAAVRLRPTLAFAARAFPTGAAILAGIGSWRLGLLVLAAAGPGAAVDAGWYAAAHRVLEAARFLPGAAAAALFPGFARRGATRELALALALGVPCAAAAAALGASPFGGAALTLAFGPAYAGAHGVLRPLLWACPFLSANAFLTFWLIARGHAKLNAALSLVHLFVHAGALALLVPRYGAVGAAWALAAAETALCAALSLAVLRSR